MNRLLILLLLLANVARASTQPEIRTSGDCSAIAIAGGRVDAPCKFFLSDQSKRVLGKLVIQNAWLKPSLGFMSPRSTGGRDERADLTTVVRNLTNEDLVLDAVHLQIVGKTDMNLRGSLMGPNVLESTIGSTAPITVKAGQTAEVTFGDTIELPGIIEAVEREDNVDSAYLVEAITPPRINGDEYVNKFADLMTRLYGKKTVLRVTYYTRDYQPVAKIDIPINKGVTFFYEGERYDDKTGRHDFRPLLAYDAYLGGYLTRKAVIVPSFKVRKPVHRCIDIIPDSTVSGGWRSHEADCEDGESAQDHTSSLNSSTSNPAAVSPSPGER